MKEKIADISDYKFKDFAHTLRNIANPNYSEDFFTQELFENIVTDECVDSILDNISSKTYGYYYNGRSIKELCRKIGNYLDENKFVEWLENLELDEEHMNLLYKELKKIGVKFDKRNKNKSVAKYFKNLIFERSIIKKSDNLVFKMKMADDYIAKTIEQGNRELDSRVSQFYEYKRSNKNNETKMYLKPKSEAIAKKVPIQISGTFDVENATNEELYNLNHINELRPLINYNNQPLKLPKIKESYKTINGIPIPNESVEINEIGSNMILLPRNDLKKIAVSFSIHNDNMDVYLNDIELTVINQPTRTYITNNNRNIKFPYNFELIYDFNKEHTEMKSSFNIGLRKEFVYDTRTVLKYLKIRRMLDDKNSSVKITTTEMNQPLFFRENVGYCLFTENDYNNLNKYIEEVEKIIFLEDAVDVRFKFDIEWFEKNRQAVDIAYAALKKEKIFIYGITSWSIESDKDTLNDLELESKIRFEPELSSIELFNRDINIPKTKLLINDAQIKRICTIGNKKEIDIIANSLTVIPSNNRLLENKRSS